MYVSYEILFFLKDAINVSFDNFIVVNSYMFNFYINKINFVERVWHTNLVLFVHECFDA